MKYPVPNDKWAKKVLRCAQDDKEKGQDDKKQGKEGRKWGQGGRKRGRKENEKSGAGMAKKRGCCIYVQQPRSICLFL